MVSGKLSELITSMAHSQFLCPPNLKLITLFLGLPDFLSCQESDTCSSFSWISSPALITPDNGLALNSFWGGLLNISTSEKILSLDHNSYLFFPVTSLESSCTRVITGSIQIFQFFFLNSYCVKNELYVYGSTYGILLSHQKRTK